MWTNSLLKQNAKDSLKNYYWMAVLASFIASLLCGAGGGGGGRAASSSSSSSGSEMNDLFGNIASETDLDVFLGATIAVLLVFVLIIIAISFVYSIFLGYPIMVGHNRFYLDARRGDVSVGKLFFQFKEGRYMATVKTMFFMYLKIFLWSLLFYIPGVIKTYEYFLVPYIVAENPYISRERAFEISRETMNGEKMGVFLLQLSFFGWFLLGAVTIVGMFFVMPYYNATMAEFYCCMRAKALSQGIARPDELIENY